MMTRLGDDPATARRTLETMWRCRRFEEAVDDLFARGLMHGTMHLSIGQEASATGTCFALREDDAITSTHRGHSHCIAKGADLERMMAELLAKETGYCRGRGGSMHLADVATGNLGANGIVGGGIPIAAGAGLAYRLQGIDRVAVSFFGDGASNEGAFHEGVNLAAIWDLPVIFLCENNVYAEFSDSRKLTRVPSVVDRCRAYGVAAELVDGNDVEAVFAVASSAVSRCRKGEGPVLIEAETYRWHGHYEGDAQPYKPEDEAAGWNDRDPLTVATAHILGAGLETEQRLQELRDEAQAVVEAAVEAARAADPPALEEAYEHVYRD
jgi:pyruvate dehydrogenase E1 component alpha subunit